MRLRIVGEVISPDHPLKILSLTIPRKNIVDNLSKRRFIMQVNREICK